MNEERRKSLTRALDLIEDARNIVDEIKGEEEEAFENLPESMQSGDKGEKAQAAIEALSEAYDALDNAIEHISTAKE
jgi:NifU-like protein involved in Fe-S cluster formation